MKANISGRELFYVTVGARSTRPPMLMLHGGAGLDHTYLRHALDPLASEGELVYFDLSGCGRSERAPEASLGLARWAAEVDGLRAHLDTPRVVLFGHSFGGFLALECALRYPATVAGLVVCSAAPAFDHIEASLRIAKSRLSSEAYDVLTKGMSERMQSDEAYRAAWNDILPLYFHRFDPELAAAMDAETIYSAAALNAGFASLRGWSVVERLGEITAPALILAGRKDWQSPAAQTFERLKSGIRHADVHVFEHSGHFPFLEEREAFLSVVRGWLKDLRPGAGSAMRA